MVICTETKSENRCRGIELSNILFRRTEQVDFQILCVIEFSSFSWIELCLLYGMCYFILLKGVIMCKNLWLKVICNLHSSIYFWIRDKDSIFSDLHNKHLWSCFRCVILSLKWLLKTVFVYFIVCFLPHVEVERNWINL